MQIFANSYILLILPGQLWEFLYYLLNIFIPLSFSSIPFISLPSLSSFLPSFLSDFYFVEMKK